MAKNDLPTCIECLGPISPADDHIIRVGAEDEEQRPAHQHRLCHDFGAFLAFNYKSGRTIQPGSTLSAWEGMARFYSTVEIRALPNAFYRSKEMYEAILRNRQKARKGE